MKDHFPEQGFSFSLLVLHGNTIICLLFIYYY